MSFTNFQMFQHCHLIPCPKIRLPLQLWALGSVSVLNATKAATLTLHGSYVSALNIIFKFDNLLLEIIKRHEFILFILFMRSKTARACASEQQTNQRQV